ncbi:MAG: DUF1616 domain-containing protein [Dehalococcoidales bacterium]|nr:DUF1616 domain-containing protein [Dehalococcoidales bacterium]
MDFNQILGSFLPLLERVPFIRAVIGFILVFFLPGFVWTLALFKEINILERLALSFGLSIAVVTLTMIIMNVLLGVRINGLSMLVVIAVNIIVPFGWYYFVRLLHRNPQE